MENPEGWDILTASIAVCGSEKPFFTWSFLVVQGIVRDFPGNRQTFCRILQRARSEHESERVIGGHSLALQVAWALADTEILLPPSSTPDPNANIARERLQTLKLWKEGKR
jgi:hypothetical protein